jgi:hypothetical protein
VGMLWGCCGDAVGMVNLKSHDIYLKNHDIF